MTGILTAGAFIGASLVLLLLYGERGLTIRRSTRSFLRMHGLRNILNFKAVHAYVYIRWTKQYIGFALNRLVHVSGKRSRKAWSDRYHGKVLTHDHARAIVTLDRSIPLRDLEQIIPYPTARSLVLNGPPDIVVHDCVCRLARATPCSPSQVCMIIGRPFTDMILEHNPKSRRLTQAEALELLRQEHERGHLHSAWFKDVMLDRFYAICNCCKCCCGGLEGMVKYGMGNIASSGYVASVDASLCDGCGACETVCPFRAVSAVDGKSAVLWERCMGCGVCEARCPRKAMSLVRDEKKGLPFDVRLMV